jgi:N-acetylglucosaminyldiphosphoundecaprenol N-acetyl-beta-D-mannosaminyltransferase
VILVPDWLAELLDIHPTYDVRTTAAGLHSPRMTNHGTRDGLVVSGYIPDDLLRDVYCVLGIPVDAIGMQSCLHRIEAAAALKLPYLISTPNLNFLVTSQSDPDFRESLLLSDLCPADGMPIVWIARLLGIPIRSRVAGSDIFDALKTRHNTAKPLKVFIFGGAEGVAAAASRALNARPGGLYCVGSLYPGFGSVDEFSRDDTIHEIKSSGADFLVVSLGAKKGQAWLQRNHHNLVIPIRAHLGASINFQAGTVERSPLLMQKLGLEWLWRIRQEPHLWRRYWNDGRQLLRLLVTRVLPLAICRWSLRLKYEGAGQDFGIMETHGYDSVKVSLTGAATVQHIDRIVSTFRAVITSNKRIVIDLSNTRAIDARVLGLLLMLRKKLKGSGADLILIGLSHDLERMFRLNGLEFLLSSDNGERCNSSR